MLLTLIIGESWNEKENKLYNLTFNDYLYGGVFER